MDKKTLAAVERLAVRVVETLPDSQNQRRELLNTILDALPADSDVRVSACLMKRLMEQIDKNQQQLILDFQIQQQKGNGK